MSDNRWKLEKRKEFGRQLGWSIDELDYVDPTKDFVKEHYRSQGERSLDLLHIFTNIFKKK